MKAFGKSGLMASAALISMSLAACQSAPATAQEADDTSDFMEKHQSITILDTHLDTPALLVQPWFDITERHDYQKDYTQVDLPRMDEGGLDGGF